LILFLSPVVNSDTIKCHFCGESIAGDYYIFEGGLTICAGCRQTSPRCDLCGVPMKEFRTIGEKKACLRCYDKAILCDLCGGLITGEYKIFSGDRKVCSNCLQLPDKCVSCGIPLRRSVRTVCSYPISVSVVASP